MDVRTRTCKMRVTLVIHSAFRCDSISVWMKELSEDVGAQLQDIAMGECHCAMYIGITGEHNGKVNLCREEIEL